MSGLFLPLARRGGRKGRVCGWFSARRRQQHRGGR